MSNGYECSATDCPRPVAWLVTRLGGGGTIAFCEDDFAPGIIYFLAADLGVDGRKLYDSITRFTDRQHAAAVKAEARAAREAEAAQAEPPTTEAPSRPPGPEGMRQFMAEHPLEPEAADEVTS